MKDEASQARVAELESENARFRTSILNAKGIIAKLEEERDAARAQVMHEVGKREEACEANLQLSKENRTLAANVVHQENVKLKKQVKQLWQNATEDKDALWRRDLEIEKLTKKRAKLKKRRREDRDIAHEAALAYVAEIKRLKDTIGELMAQLDEVLSTQQAHDE